MDILGRYENKSPIHNEIPEAQSFAEYGMVVRMAMKLSGGRITKLEEANTVLIIVTALMMVVSVFFLFGRSTSYDEKVTLPMPIAGPGDSKFH